jgi:predicted transposase YbfD/YdcC
MTLLGEFFRCCLLKNFSCIVTIDAMGRQKKIAVQIVDNDADYVLIALYLLLSEKSRQVGINKAKRKMAGWDDPYLKKVLGG